MVKKLILTEDHLKLITCIKFNGFDFGDRFETSDISNVLNTISEDKDMLNKFGYLCPTLEKIILRLKRLDSEASVNGWGVNQYNLFGGTYVLEDVAKIIGRYDKYVEGTKEDPQGADFADEDKDYMWGLYSYIWENMEYIFDLLLFYCTKEPLKPGVYSLDRNGGWFYAEAE